MPRPGPRRPYIAVRLDQPLIDAIDRRAATAGLLKGDGEPNRSEQIRRMVAYADKHMPDDSTPDN